MIMRHFMSTEENGGLCHKWSWNIYSLWNIYKNEKRRLGVCVCVCVGMCDYNKCCLRFTLGFLTHIVHAEQAMCKPPSETDALPFVFHFLFFASATQCLHRFVLSVLIICTMKVFKSQNQMACIKRKLHLMRFSYLTWLPTSDIVWEKHYNGAGKLKKIILLFLSCNVF